MASGEDPQARRDESEQPDAPEEQAEPTALGALRGEVPAELRDVSFPVSMRGYDRSAVDAYVKRVNRVIAELEVSRSPQAAVRHALDRVGQQTSGVLQRAREAAEELTTTALAETEQAKRRASVEAEETLEDALTHAEKLLADAKQESGEILAAARSQASELTQRAQDRARAVHADAEQRLREVRAETADASDARARLLKELQRTAAELDRFASSAVERLGDEAPPGEAWPEEGAGGGAPREPTRGSADPADGGRDEPASRERPGEEPTQKMRPQRTSRRGSAEPDPGRPLTKPTEQKR